MMKKIIIITGNELRHDFFRKFLGSCSEIKVLKTFCEVPENSLKDSIVLDKNNSSRSEHLIAREQTEKDFFELFCSNIKDNSNAVFITKGEINSNDNVEEIINLNPDLIISYGCSIIKSKLLEIFKGRFINIHLGLSPYYRGSGTNFFPFVNDEISCVGVTFMYIDKENDAGKIIHQIRPTVCIGDSVHQIGNRLIKEMTLVCEKIIISFDSLMDMEQLNFDFNNEKVYKKKDFTEETVTIVYKNFSSGIIEKYLKNKFEFDSKFPIIQNQIL